MSDPQPAALSVLFHCTLLSVHTVNSVSSRDTVEIFILLGVAANNYVSNSARPCYPAVAQYTAYYIVWRRCCTRGVSDTVRHLSSIAHPQAWIQEAGRQVGRGLDDSITDNIPDNIPDNTPDNIPDKDCKDQAA